jgi:hypothetical protein
MSTHKSFDPTTAEASFLRSQRGMDPRAATASAAVLMDLADRQAVSAPSAKRRWSTVKSAI